MLEIFIIIGLIGLTSSIAHGLRGPQARARRRLRRGPTKLADRELVTISGTVRSCGDALAAPFSGRACIAYEATADLFRNRNAYSQPDRFRFGETTNFELVTDSHVIAVGASPVDLALTTRPHIPRSLERERAFLEAHEKPVDYVFKSKFEEGIVVEGDHVVVQGMAIVEQASDDASERGYREAPTRVRLVAHPQHPLTIGKSR